MLEGSADSLSETDWETTRYLAVATQLNLRYARFVISQIISIVGFYFSFEFSYVIAFVLFIVLILIRPRGLFAR